MTILQLKKRGVLSWAIQASSTKVELRGASSAYAAVEQRGQKKGRELVHGHREMAHGSPVADRDVSDP